MSVLSLLPVWYLLTIGDSNWEWYIIHNIYILNIMYLEVLNKLNTLMWIHSLLKKVIFLFCHFKTCYSMPLCSFFYNHNWVVQVLIVLILLVICLISYIYMKYIHTYIYGIHILDCKIQLLRHQFFQTQSVDSTQSQSKFHQALLKISTKSF